jgi:hypothetical protein
MLSQTTLRAVTVGMEADRRMKRGFQGASVHSSYDGAVNVTTGLGLISLVPPHVGRGPINITIDGDFRRLMTSASTGEGVMISKDAIRIGPSAAVSLVGSKRYNPPWKFSHRPLASELIRSNVRTARETAITHGNFSGMGTFLHNMGGDALGASKVGLNSLSLLALPHLRALVKGLGDEDLDRVRSAVKRLVGLGIGLTPSADDVLSGLMVALVLCAKNGLAPGPFCAEAAQGITETSVGRSSTLSEEYLCQASLGRSNEKVSGLVESICSGTSSEVDGRTSDLIAMGHASGTDTTVGVILGVNFVLGKYGGRTAK